MLDKLLLDKWVVMRPCIRTFDLFVGLFVFDMYRQSLES